jgi:microcystin-dependent protein
MAFSLTPNMALPVPGVGTEGGPTYATYVNKCLTIIDGHNHSIGSGTQITPSGLNLNADVSIQGNNLTLARSIRLAPQASVLVGSSDLGCLFEVGPDLYYNDGSGNHVRITQYGAVAGTPGSIANLVSPASASYSSAAKTFTFQSAALTPAILDGASITLRNLTASSYGLSLQPPTLTNDVTITLPPIPASNLPVSIDNTGVMSTAAITQAQLSSALQTLLAGYTASIAANTPSGLINAYGGATAPTGWLMCDGSSQLRSAYPNLFTAIGTAFGSADASHFNLPNGQGTFLRGVQGANAVVNDPDSASRTAQATGGATGNNVGSIQSGQIQSHSHSLPAATVSSGGGGTTPISSSAGPNYNAGINASGGNETRPVNLYVNFIIKT